MARLHRHALGSDRAQPARGRRGGGRLQPLRTAGHRAFRRALPSGAARGGALLLARLPPRALDPVGHVPQCDAVEHLGLRRRGRTRRGGARAGARLPLGDDGHHRAGEPRVHLAARRRHLTRPPPERRGLGRVDGRPLRAHRGRPRGRLALSLDHSGRRPLCGGPAQHSALHLGARHGLRGAPAHPTHLARPRAGERHPGRRHPHHLGAARGGVRASLRAARRDLHALLRPHHARGDPGAPPAAQA
mmetsp:Transcript_32741/g.83446  ORF Transcript_32741/g.83446 Transcript_32741/m.83446 type:complete len:246 (+) Transcript_32741:632-1369(+)